MLPIQHFTSGVLAEILRRQPPSPARTALAWQIAVGPVLARVTTVELNDGLLIVQSSDARWTVEIARARGIVLERLRDLLGPESVREVHVER
jgi:hypothetical protein